MRASVSGGVEAHVGVIWGSELGRVIVLVFLLVGGVDPAEGVHEHVVQGGGYVAHQGHEEEGDLEDVVLDEVQAADEVVIP